MTEQKLIMVKDVAGNPVACDPNDPLLFCGVLWPNKSRRAEAERARTQREAWLAAGGVITHVEPGLAGGVQRKSTHLKRRTGNGRPAAEKLETGDRKYDMYANALPPPIRAILQPRDLDPRQVYKEYRALGKAKLLEKYGVA